MTGMMLALPALTAVLAIVCGLRPSARRTLWFALGLAALTLVLTPLTSGEWFYQRAEQPAFADAVARADYSALENLHGRHDPLRLHKMIALAAALLAAVSSLVVVRHRAPRFGMPVSTAAVVVGLGSLVALYLLGSGAGPIPPV